MWATLIALECDGVVTIGVASAPALGARWWAARGAGAYRSGSGSSGTDGGGEPIEVSKVARVEDAHLAYDSVAAFESVGRDAEFLALCRRCWRTRGFGDFWAHMLVADGSIDIAVEVGGLKIWDLAAVQVIVEVAGGRFSDLAGAPRPDGGDGLSTNGLLHDDVLAALGGLPTGR